MSDSEVQRLRSGNADAFGSLYELHVRKIYDFLYYKTFDQETAEDLTQETFFKALKKIDSFKGSTVAEFSSWLYKIAYHTAIDHFRTSDTHGELDEASEQVAYSENFGADIDHRSKLEEVMDYLNTISADQKDILVMRIWDELSYAEISEITGKTVDNCKKIVSRALAQIQSNIAYLCILAHFLNYITQ